MSTVEVGSLLRLRDGSFVPIAYEGSFEKNCAHMEGAITLKIDGVELFGTELWDDINWLWPSLIAAVESYRNTGAGKSYFPDQPIAIQIEATWGGNALLRLNDIPSGNRSALVHGDQLVIALARAGIDFYEHYLRRCPAEAARLSEPTILAGWLEVTAAKPEAPPQC